MRLSGAQTRNLGLLIAALVSLVIVRLTANRPTTTEQNERARNLVSHFNDDEVLSLRFFSGNKSFRVERLRSDRAKRDTREGDFTLYAPDREPADPAAVDRLLSAIGFATPVRRLEGGDLAALGLSHPEVTLEIAGDADDKKWEVRIALGKQAPSPEGAAYVSVNGQLAVVSKEVATLIRTQPDDLRVHALVPLGKSDLRELVLERAGSTLRLVRKDQSFRIDEKERANRDALEPVFGALARLEAKRFLGVQEAEKARGGPPRLIVRALPSDPKEQPVVLELGGACPTGGDEIIAITRSPRVSASCVERVLGVHLEVERERLFDTEPFSARADEVETLRIERGARHLTLARRGSAFLLREPSEATVELEAGNQRLTALLRAPAELVHDPDLKKLGLDPPDGRVVATTIGDNDKAVEEVLFLGHTALDGTLSARRAEDGAVLSLGRDAARAFAVDTTLLRSLKIGDFALSELSELELSAPEHQLLRRTPSGLELVEPRGFEHDGELATDAVLAFGSLTALRFVADADDGSFGFEKPTLTARARYAADGGSRESRLVVGRATPGGFFAKRDADPSVFVIERSAAERLGTLLVDRSAFAADAKTLARITITSNGVTRMLERRHDELVATEASGLDPAVAARLIEALDALRAESAVHTGGPQPNEGFQKPALEIRFEPLSGLGKARSFSVGASGVASSPGAEGAQATHYARARGIEATFLIADSQLKPLFDLF